MKRLIAGVVAACLVGSVGGFGPRVATSDPGFPWLPAPPSPVGANSGAKVVYALGGARPPAFNWTYYTNRAGEGFFPGAKRELIEYPAGAPFAWMPTFIAPGPRDMTTIGKAAKIAVDNLDTAVRHGTEPAAAVGLSQGGLGIDGELARLANDPTAPPPDKLSFTSFGDPSGTNGFGMSFLASFFKPGDYIPIVDYKMPARPDSQYNTNRVFAAYDGLADFPDRMDNLLALVNCAFGAAIGHTPAAFIRPDQVPPQNIRTTVNSRGATETSYMIPVNHLPMTLPLRYLGWSDAKVDQIDAVLQPQIDAGYSHNDNPLNRPTAVDPVNGMDPLAIVDPGMRDSIEDAFAKIRAILPPPPP
ncbi:PE-PPE domain-containing protein [Mycobacterium saskatchewanense]|uniref:PE-PPE domain-containing protein n=1 Tax=Mycobacterium saskatchewanense TaxID=220927 RepID=A0AAJ3NM13_9MYCO|nr:PE-PPE domain-containing protein [Mycobacterium saskatchewanense]ORW64879.1 PE-PPE domain-containing protein [Mycobacterium saskatchewanense]